MFHSLGIFNDLLYICTWRLACDLLWDPITNMLVDELVWNIQHGKQIDLILLGLSQISSFFFLHRKVLETPRHLGIWVMIYRNAWTWVTI